MSDTILVTGACGFIGSHFVRMLNETKYDGAIVIVDKLTYAGKKENIEGIPADLCVVDISDATAIDDVFKRYKPNMVVNFAAETHVDRSIVSSTQFTMTNFIGVQVLLDACLKFGIERFLQVSTDEVYGDVAEQRYASVEDDKLAPSSPYSASKAAADLLALSYVRTHKLDVVITRCTNNYGPYQYPEKLIPVVITKALNGQPVPVYGKGENMRDWIYVSDHCAGIWAALVGGRTGEIYNFAGGKLLKNIDVVRRILKLFGKDDRYIEYVEDRKGHDVKYWMSYEKAKRELDWTPVMEFDQGIVETVEWYKGAISSVG
jgi:dTDP-glucose 4,6-dehydratase